MIEPKEEEKKVEQRGPKTFAGLSWPDKGYASYYCIVTQKSVGADKTFDAPDPSIIVLSEGDASGYAFLKECEKKKCMYVYAPYERKYMSYIADISRYKREENINVRFRQTNTPSVEAAILKIKDFVLKKKIEFPDESVIRDQLTVFSRDSLDDATPFYAVRALCSVIGQFKKTPSIQTAELPNIGAWW